MSVSDKGKGPESSSPAGKSKRRFLSPEKKYQVFVETQRGESPVGELLRREGLYSTDLARIQRKVKDGALEQGQNTITATAVDTFGHTVSNSITVNAEISGDYVLITADPESGVSPFETTLRIEASFNFSTSSLDYTGPGTVEFISNPDPSEYRVRMTIPGLYAFTVEVADSESNLHTDTVTVLVLNPEILDGMLREKWNKMKNALSSGDVPKAVSYISEGSKDMYQYNFNLMSAYLQEIASGLQDIAMVNIKDRMAEYEMCADQDGQMYSFYILFVKDPDGIWKVDFF